MINLPLDLVGALEDQLAEARERLEAQVQEADALDQLLGRAIILVARERRHISVIDLLDAATGEEERARTAGLLRQLGLLEQRPPRPVQEAA